MKQVNITNNIELSFVRRYKAIKSMKKMRDFYDARCIKASDLLTDIEDYVNAMYFNNIRQKDKQIDFCKRFKEIIDFCYKCTE